MILACSDDQITQFIFILRMQPTILASSCFSNPCCDTGMIYDHHELITETGIDALHEGETYTATSVPVTTMCYSSD